MNIVKFRKSKPAIIKTNNNINIEVYFDSLDREDGYDDDIRMRLHETTEQKVFFKSDEVAFLLTPEQAEELAKALNAAALDSRNTPR